MSDHPIASILESDLSRRDLLRNAIAGVLLTMPWLRTVEAAAAAPSPVKFTRNRTGDGVVGPFGEVRVVNSSGVILPAFVTATGGLASMNLAVRAPTVQIGADDTMILLTSAGVQFGKAAAPKPWTADTVRALIESIAKDPKKARGAMLLRSALHTTMPVAAIQLKGQMDKKFSTAMAKGTRGLGSSSMQSINCRTVTITDTVVKYVTEYVDVWKTAEKQYQECYDREVRGDNCKWLGGGAGACAAGICLLKGFVDVVIGVAEVVTRVVEEVTRRIIVCTKAAIGTWPNPWDIPGFLSKVGIGQPAATFSSGDIAEAIKLLKQFTGFFGVYGGCLLNGTWTLQQLTTPLDLGGGKVVLPYGVKVCVTSKCAEQMALSNVGGELLASWSGALSILAAFSPELMAFAASLGIPASAAVVTAIASLPPVVVACAALILGFILAVLYYGTMIAGQLEYHRLFTTNFSDGVVCIEHPTFALALISVITTVPATTIIPPIVTG